MEEDLARIIARTAFRCSAILTGLVPMLKDKLDEKEYKSMASAIGECSYAIDKNICRPIYKSHPEIEKEFEHLIRMYNTIG
jgi:hypothetical protein